MHRCSLHCIIPPYMMDAIRENGDDEQRQMLDVAVQDAVDARMRRAFTKPQYAWEAVVRALGGSHGFALESTGGVASSGLKRFVHDAGQQAQLPGTLMREEGGAPVTDPAVNEAYDHAGMTYALFKEVYGRDSLDGKGLPLVLSVHYRRDHNNAYWNGSQMLFGDADGKLFTRGIYTRSLSVVGHELTHGVVQFSGELDYSNQSGALNEHIADSFGVLAEQFHKKQSAAEAAWVVGDGLILGVGGATHPLRSMKAPGTAYVNHPILKTDPQPAHMKDFNHTKHDNGGVHINSGIPNHAFFLLAQELGGNAWERAGQIWYKALQELQNPQAQFVQWADATVRTAHALYGAGSKEQQATQNAWKGVGVL